jgi:tRNA-dihydrouridine synthase A
MLDRRVSVAPMMDWTDRHDRFFLRLIAKHALLYTEMVTTRAIIHGDQQKLLRFHPAEHPLALQLGGNNPKEFAECAIIAADRGFDEINMNVGCPSDRVQNGEFGACLMAKPTLVAECVAAMKKAVTLPITVKTRIGIDHQDSYEELHYFIKTVSNAGCQTFIIHARKAWLQGLSPRQNREVPPLRYDVVRQVKTDFPECEIIINGGITTLENVIEHLRIFDGVMLGRAAYQNPYLLADIESAIFSANEVPLSRSNVIQQLIPYVEEQMQEDVYPSAITRHILGLFLGQAGAKVWRRFLSTHSHKTRDGKQLLLDALQAQQRATIHYE